MVDVSMVIPCLNEARTLDACIANAAAALAEIKRRFRLTGEVVVADNGSSDGSQEIATRAGARVVPVARRGYGAAIIGGMHAARGRFLVMGDADGSYDFADSVAMVERLLGGAELCMGSRFAGEIKPGAMPWKNRYIGNPLLSGFLRLLFRSKVSDAHCGLRALTKTCFLRLNLTGTGMEFASEMVIKAALLKVRTEQVAITLYPDLRDRPPHLRPWRDGWRHLRYLLMLSPAWVFLLPALIGAIFALLVFGTGGSAWLSNSTSPVGNYWTIFAAALMQACHVFFFMGAAAQVHGVREGFREPSSVRSFAIALSLERMLITGAALFAVGAAILAAIVFYWTAQDYERIGNVFPAVLGTSLAIIGIQNVLGGFLLSVVGGNDPSWLEDLARDSHRSEAGQPAAIDANAA